MLYPALGADFEDKLSNLFAFSPDALVPAETYLVSEMPARVYPPGEIVAYSNYGAALAGYIVERVSGVPYERYVEEHILDPLGMQHTTLAQPAPAELADDAAMGHLVTLNGAIRLSSKPASTPTGVSLLSPETCATIQRAKVAHIAQGPVCPYQ
jgi:CubicO group peptidase (beta-lactamase class C family)